MTTVHPNSLVRASILLALTPIVEAQAPQPKPGSDVSLARHVPPQVAGFAFFRELNDVDAAIRQTQAWRLLGLLTGVASDGGAAFSLRTQAQLLLGPTLAIEPEELDRAAFAVAVGSWDRWSTPVWLIRPPRAQVLDRWLPGLRRTGTEPLDVERLPGTASGMHGAVRGRVAALARPGTDAALMRDVVQLMYQPEAPTLDGEPEYRELLSFLPARPLGVVYGVFSGHAPLLGCRKVVAGLYSTEGRIDVAFRGKRAEPIQAPSLGGRAVDALATLPASTVWAWAMAIPNAAPPAEEAGPINSGVGRFLDLLGRLQDAGPTPTAPLAPIGPRIVVAWDQDFDDSTSGPLLALLVESGRARELAAELEQAVERWLESDGAEPGALLRSSHFGAMLTHLRLDAVMGGSSWPIAGALAQLELSWAAHGEWLIFALSREHLQRLVDARLNLVPTLANVPDVQSLRRRRSNLTSLMIAQPDLASGVLRRWLERPHIARSPWLDPLLWRAPFSESDAGKRLGIGMRTEQTPGMAVVARVYTGTLAEGVLLPEDAIVGVDGELLDFASPNADLRRRWAVRAPSGEHVFRVLRDGQLVDIALRKAVPQTTGTALAVEPPDALRELAAMGQGVRFASWATHATDEGQYSALISLRLAPPASTVERR